MDVQVLAFLSRLLLLRFGDTLFFSNILLSYFLCY